jgi:hypothetical protein
VINRDVWLRQMRNYIRFVANETAVRRVWIDREPGITSVGDFDELFEQVFDDLDADALSPEMLADDEESQAIVVFLEALRQASDAHPTVGPADAEAFLASPEWRSLNSAARSALEILP